MAKNEKAMNKAYQKFKRRELEKFCALMKLNIEDADMDGETDIVSADFRAGWDAAINELNNTKVYMNTLTLEAIRKAKKLANDCAIHPHYVKTQKEAKILSKNDPCGYKWKVGEAYYIIFESGLKNPSFLPA